MKSFEFTIIASGLDPDANDFEDRLSEAGCDDTTISYQRGTLLLEFDRDASNFEQAIASAISDIAKAGARVERVEPDTLVSLSDIAERAGLTRAAISLYAKGHRGKDFPTPIARVSTDSPLWDWVEVAQWLHARAQITADIVEQAKVVKRVNEGIAEKRREFA